MNCSQKPTKLATILGVFGVVAVLCSVTTPAFATPIEGRPEPRVSIELLHPPESPKAGGLTTPADFRGLDLRWSRDEIPGRPKDDAAEQFRPWWDRGFIGKTTRYINALNWIAIGISGLAVWTAAACVGWLAANRWFFESRARLKLRSWVKMLENGMWLGGTGMMAAATLYCLVVNFWAGVLMVVLAVFLIGGAASNHADA